MMKIIKGHVTQPKGFKANGLSCGIKRSGKPDLGLIYSEVPAVTAGVFTKSSVKAAPLVVSQKHVRNGITQALVVNSGNANCFTGKFGRMYAEQTSQDFGQLLGVPATDVLVASTGIIGKPFPYAKLEASAKDLVKGLSKGGAQKFAYSILTTDLKIKTVAVTIELDGKIVTVGGCAKGSGMIAPNMATMLGFVTTDVAIEHALLQQALQLANHQSFNCISVDACMSTNDMVTVMANGQAGNKKITSTGQAFTLFSEALNYVCLELAKMIVLDGEGATKFIEVQVLGAQTSQQARAVSMAVVKSDLVKTAAFGKNPNWGRVAAAVGSLGIKKINEDNLKISFSSFAKKHIIITVDLNLGACTDKAYTSDLSYEYIRINAEYN